jgi:hypothetical protein
MNTLATISPAVEPYRVATDAASTCKEIVVATATKIGGRTFVAVEGWQAIAVAHGCVASAIDVHRVTDEGCEGFAATGVLRRMSDGVEIGRAEGFVGDDEKTWGKRDVYARRAMAQTRAISRVCRSAFAHVVVMMKAGLQTTPAEEVPHGGFDNPAPAPAQRAQEPANDAPEQEHKRQPLKGPIKTRAGVRTAYGNFCRELEACADEEMLEALLAAEKPLIDQIRDEAPFLRDGDGADFLGLEKEIERRRQLIAMEADSYDHGNPPILAAG